MARLTFIDTAGVWTLHQNQSLLGSIPNTTAGGGGGGTGVTTFPGLVDTPNSYAGQFGKVASVAVSESALEFANVGSILQLDNVDLTTIAQSAFPAVPTGRYFLAEKIIIIPTAVTAATVAATAQLGPSTDPDEFYLPSLLSADSLVAFGVDQIELDVNRVLAPTEILQFGVTVGATATVLEATVLVKGVFL